MSRRKELADQWLIPLVYIVALILAIYCNSAQADPREPYKKVWCEIGLYGKVKWGPWCLNTPPATPITRPPQPPKDMHPKPPKGDQS